MRMPIMRNRARCLGCDTIIESTHRHDFQWCKCPEDRARIFVDGGSSYWRWGGNIPNFQRIDDAGNPVPMNGVA